jgi:hypothetical protein
LARLRKRRAIFLVVGTAIWFVSAAKRECAMPETERCHEGESDKKYLQTTIGDLRKTYGEHFAKGCADDEKIADVLPKQPWLRRVIRHYEAKRFEQIFEV